MFVQWSNTRCFVWQVIGGHVKEGTVLYASLANTSLKRSHVHSCLACERTYFCLLWKQFVQKSVDIYILLFKFRLKAVFLWYVESQPVGIEHPSGGSVESKPPGRTPIWWICRKQTSWYWTPIWWICRKQTSWYRTSIWWICRKQTSWYRTPIWWICRKQTSW